ncbi:MAG: AAA family ATPase [Myxococcota bacterium]|nr:AAA family ATPase [Myxococcota bacterium]
MLKIEKLPTKIDSAYAVEIAYREDLDWVMEQLLLGQSILLEVDKLLYPWLWRILRSRLREKNLQAELLTGHNARTDEGPMSGPLMQRMLSQMTDAAIGSDGTRILVMPHLDVLTTTTRSGLSDNTREIVATFYDNPFLQLLVFKDPNLEMVSIVENLFSARRRIFGLRREVLAHLITQEEARKFHHEEFNPFALYSYVSGLNVLRFRQIMRSLKSRPNYNPMYPEESEDVYASIRGRTLDSSLELPRVDLHEDIGGYEHVKEQLQMEVLELLEYRQELSEEGNVREIENTESLIPKGMLFYGPPGTGKTFFAKALATALNASIIIVSGPELKSKWVGESEKNLRDVFSKARRSAPSIIVFDELDSFAQARGTYSGSGVEHSMVNQLLTEMDGFRKSEMVFVVGTTNFLQSVDSALLRPGRFELHIEIPYPQDDDRKKILQIYIQRFHLNISADLLEYMVRRTRMPIDPSKGTFYSGDHLYALCRYLRREVIRSGEADFVFSKEHIDKALRSNRRDAPELKDEERKVIAYHEAGHAIAAHYLPSCSGVERIVLGDSSSDFIAYVERGMRENRYVTTQGELLDDVCVLLSGRQAERLQFQDISAGASDDLRRATTIVQSMVSELGMSQLGPRVVLDNRDSIVSGVYAAEMDKEISRILKHEHKRSRELLNKHLSLLHRIATELLKDGKLEQKHFLEIVHAYERGE